MISSAVQAGEEPGGTPASDSSMGHALIVNPFPLIKGTASDDPAVQHAETTPVTAGDDPLETADHTQPAWSGTVELYGFGPLRTTGTTTINDTEAEVDLSLADILSALRFAAAGRATLENNRIGLIFDADYVSLAGESASLVGPQLKQEFNAKVGQIQAIYDIAFRYRFGERESAIGDPGDFSVIPFAGLRVIRESLSIDTSLSGPVFGTLLSRSRTTTALRGQTLVGTHANVFLSPRLRAFARADLAGFGITGRDDLSGNARLGLGYAVGNSTSLNLSWRYRFITISNSNDPKNALTSYQNGVEMGIKFFF